MAVDGGSTAGVSAGAPGGSATHDVAFHIERRGIDFVPETERWAKPSSLFGMWAGAITNFEIFIYGAALMAFFHVSFDQAIVIIVIGNLSYLLLGLTSLQGPDAGTTTFTVNRAAFGQNGGRLLSLFNWLTQVGFETEGIVLVVLCGEALAAKAGYAAGDPLKVVLIVAAAGIQLMLPLFGHGTIVKTLKWLAYPFVALFAILACYSWARVTTHYRFCTTATKVGAHASNACSTAGHAGALIAAHASWPTFMQALAFIIVLSGLGWTENGNDYSRYLPKDAKKSSIVGWVFAGTFIPSVVIMIIGAAAGTYTFLAPTSPTGTLPQVFAAWFLVPFLIVAIIQCFAINSLDLYSSGVTLQALGVRLRRWKTVLLDTVIAGGLTAYAVFSHHFYTLLTDFVSCLIVWIAPWTAIYLIDWALRRFRYVPGELQRDSGGLYWRNGGIHWPAIIAQFVGMFAALMGFSHSFFEGLVSSHTTGADFSVFLGLGVGGIVYWLLATRSVRREADEQDRLLAPLD